jgi:hypothetical protein
MKRGGRWVAKKLCTEGGGEWMLYKKGEKSIKGQRKEKKVITIMKEGQLLSTYISFQACRLFMQSHFKTVLSYAHRVKLAP